MCSRPAIGCYLPSPNKVRPQLRLGGLGGDCFSPQRQRLCDRVARCELRCSHRRFHTDAERAGQNRRGHANDRIDMTRGSTVTFSAFRRTFPEVMASPSFCITTPRAAMHSAGPRTNREHSALPTVWQSASIPTVIQRTRRPSYKLLRYRWCAPPLTATSLSNLENSQWHDVTVSWDAGTQILTYSIDRATGRRTITRLAGQYFGGSDYVR